MADTPEDGFFNSSDELLKYLRDKVDDIDSVVIPINPAPMQITDAQGRPRRTMRGVGAQIRLCDGRFLLVHPQDAEMLINDGILQRLKIKCQLKPMEG